MGNYQDTIKIGISTTSLSNSFKN